MNSIAFAGAHENFTGARPDKNFHIIVPLNKCAADFGGNKRELTAGDIAAVPPNVKYALRGDALIVSLEQALLPFKEVRLLRDDGTGGILHAARQAEKYFGAKNSTQSGILAALGELIAAYIAAFAGGDRLSPVVATVRDDIRKNFSDPFFSLEDSVKKLPLNYDYVRKLFKKEVGATPHGYLLNCRMQLARELISSGLSNRYSNYSVGQIAEACGFSEPLYFSRVFKKYYGVSPTEAARKWTT